MTPFESLVERTLIFIAGQLMILNAERLFQTGVEEQTADQLDKIISQFKELQS